MERKASNLKKAASFASSSDVICFESGDSETYSQHTDMDNEDSNRGYTSISDEDSIPVVITGRKYERRTIDNICYERFWVFVFY